MAGGISDYAPRRDDYSGEAVSNGMSSEEDRDLQRAIEESKRTAKEHERMMNRVSEEDLRAAIELSEREKIDREKREAEGGCSATYDPFESLDGSRGIQQRTGGSADLIGLELGGVMDQGGFSQYQLQMPQQQAFDAGGSTFGNSMNHPPLTNHATNPFGSAFGGVPIQNTGSTSGFESSAGYGAASHFTGEVGVGGGSGIPNLTRSNAQIDPFASVAGGRDAFGGGSGASRAANPFGSLEFSTANVMASTEQPKIGAATAQRQANLPSGPGGSANSGLVNLDSLMPNSSSFHQPSKNPFSFASKSTPGQYDLTTSPSGGGAAKPQPPRSLAELAAVGSGSALPSSRPVGTMMAGGAGVTGVPFGMQSSGGQPSPHSGFFGHHEHQGTQQPFGGAGAFQQPTAAGAGPLPFVSQTPSPFGIPGG
ncbi:MAG: hypothetical protein BJ554DRAFT_272 [Olpidium bornovanus]|uniref:Uncharacterized protein n=1 Tax=Olpidium bornovanus TaxID=278681 RepID=A0A8H8DIB8_9FUNG|nr:MAG: hypothetical protein BJ554DRAFT_272 [Olpidium bornovanus]